MSVHHRPLRSSLATVAIAGAATLATVFASTPAMADDLAPTEGAQTTDGADETPAGAGDVTPEATPEATDDSTDDQGTGDDTGTDGSGDETADDTGSEDTESEVAPEPAADEKDTVVAPLKAAAAAADEIVADFGYEKFRVGVQVADGSYVPEGGTVGSTFQITFSGGDTFTCTTEGDPDDEDGYSQCPGDLEIPGPQLARGASIEDGGIGDTDTYTIPPGQTATIVQTGTVEGLELAPETAVLAPCESGDESDACNSFAAADVIFDNAGTPPVAVDDSATTDEGVAVDIDLLANDDPSVAPITGFDGVDEAAHGTVELVDDGVVRYTPDAGFNGTDTFTYALSTPNGTDTATVTVTVVAAEVVAPAADEIAPPRAAAPVSSALPDTGGPDASLLGYGALLLAGGGWLTARARRRTAADRG